MRWNLIGAQFTPAPIATGGECVSRLAFQPTIRANLKTMGGALFAGRNDEPINVPNQRRVGVTQH